MCEHTRVYIHACVLCVLRALTHVWCARDCMPVCAYTYVCVCAYAYTYTCVYRRVHMLYTHSHDLSTRHSSPILGAESQQAPPAGVQVSWMGRGCGKGGPDRTRKDGPHFSPLLPPPPPLDKARSQTSLPHHTPTGARTDVGMSLPVPVPLPRRSEFYVSIYSSQTGKERRLCWSDVIKSNHQLPPASVIEINDTIFFP